MQVCQGQELLLNLIHLLIYWSKKLNYGDFLWSSQGPKIVLIFQS